MRREQVNFHAKKLGIARLRIICLKKGISMAKGINDAIREWNVSAVKDNPELAADVDAAMLPIIRSAISQDLEDLGN